MSNYLSSTLPLHAFYIEILVNFLMYILTNILHIAVLALNIFRTSHVQNTSTLNTKNWFNIDIILFLDVSLPWLGY